MHIHIAQVNGVLFEGDGDALIGPGSEGVLTILPNHIPLATVLTEGRMVVKQGGEVIFEREIERGVLEVTQEGVTVLL